MHNAQCIIVSVIRFRSLPHVVILGPFPGVILGPSPGVILGPSPGVILSPFPGVILSAAKNLPPRTLSGPQRQ